MSVYYKWYRRFFGCSKIKAECKKEELINSLTKKQIDFWGTEVTEDGELTLYGSVFSAGKIIDEGENLGCGITVVERIGLPFLFEKYKKRYGIMVGIILAWSFMFFTSLFVWEVNVSVRSGENEEQICELLEECGLEMGSFLPRLNVRKVENEFLLRNPEYSFLAVNICGTVANIEIRRASPHEAPESLDRLCNVVAAKSGTVISVEAYGGAPLVKAGDTVLAGDVLISAYMQGRLGVWRGVHAYGKVTAAVYYDFETEIPLNYKMVRLTGEKETKLSLQVLNFGVDLFRDEKSSFSQCTTKSQKERVEIFGIKLPIIKEKSVYLEEETFFVTLTEERAKEKGEEEFALWLERETKGEILSKSLSGELDAEKGVYVIKGSVTVSEDIGQKQFLES